VPEETFEIFRNSLGFYLRTARTRLGYSLRELEGISGVSDAQIRRIECGDFNCAIDTFLRLCVALGLPFGELLECIATPTESLVMKSLNSDPAVKALLREAGMLSDWQRAVGLQLLASLGLLLAHCVFSSNPAKRFADSAFADDPMKRALEPLVASLDSNIPADARLRFLCDLQQACLPTLLSLGFASHGEMVALLKRHSDRPSMTSAFFGPEPQNFPAWLPNPDLARIYSFTPFENWRKQQALDKFLNSESIRLMRLTWASLKSQLRKATEPRGKRAALAKSVGIYQSRLNSWLDGEEQPGAELTFRLLEWVATEEAKQQSPGGALTPPEQMTPKGIKSEQESPARSRKRGHKKH